MTASPHNAYLELFGDEEEQPAPETGQADMRRGNRGAIRHFDDREEGSVPTSRSHRPPAVAIHGETLLVEEALVRLEEGDDDPDR